MKRTWTVISIYWLIKLRWYAIAFVLVITFLANYVLDISLQVKEIVLLDMLLLILNVFSLVLISRIDRMKSFDFPKAANFILNFQISTDYILLTALLHYSGGVENPFIIVYLFHMILAGIMLPFRQSFMQTTFALILLGAMAIAEHNNLIEHHCLQGFVSHPAAIDSKFLIWNSLIFIMASYLILYMTNFITGNLRKFEKENRLANIELNRKDKIKNEFVLRLTHDIKGHIYAIQTLLSVLRSNILGKMEPRQEEFLNKAYNRTKVLSDFARDLLNHTQLLMSKEQKKVYFSLREIAEKVVNNYSNNAKWKSIIVSFHMDDKINEIYGNQILIEALLSNLFFNAIKYTPEKGSVSLNIYDKKNKVLIEVADTGIGIKEEDQSKIFDEFYRANNAKEFDKQGTGMGLSIVAQIVKVHRAKIWFESKFNEGTTFHISIPKTPR